MTWKAVFQNIPDETKKKICSLNVFLSFNPLIDQLLLQNGPNFALIHAMSFHPFVVLLCLELHSREEEI